MGVLSFAIYIGINEYLGISKNLVQRNILSFLAIFTSIFIASTIFIQKSQRELNINWLQDLRYFLISYIAAIFILLLFLALLATAILLFVWTFQLLSSFWFNGLETALTLNSIFDWRKVDNYIFTIIDYSWWLLLGGVSLILMTALWANKSNKLLGLLLAAGLLGVFKLQLKFPLNFQPRFEYKPTAEFSYPDYECMIPIRELDKIEYQISEEMLDKTAEKTARTVLNALDEKKYSGNNVFYSENSRNLKIEKAGKLDTSSLKELKIICNPKSE